MWGEEYLGGSAEVENKIFERFAPDIMQVQTRVQRRLNRHGVKHPIQRAFHAKATLTVDDAELRFGELPDDLQVGFAQPGAEYPTIVRFSNASGTVEPDRKPDLRGIALRVCVDDNTSHDLLATNFPVSHARDATQFVEFAKQTAGGKVSRLFGLVNLARRFGIPDTFRMVRNVMTASRQSVSSIATQTYWSRGAMTWGPRWPCGSFCGRHRTHHPVPIRIHPIPRTSPMRRHAVSWMGIFASNCASNATSTRP